MKFLKLDKIHDNGFYECNTDVISKINEVVEVLNNLGIVDGHGMDTGDYACWSGVKPVGVIDDMFVSGGPADADE